MGACVGPDQPIPSVPPHIDERAAFEAIGPEKDVDGVTMSSFGAMSFGLPGFASCTPGGIMRLLDEYDVDLAGQHAVVVGRSTVLGKPVGMLLLARDATVTYCHSRTTDQAATVRESDVVVAAVGRPRLIRGEDVKPGAVVIDARYNPGIVPPPDLAATSTCLLLAGCTVRHAWIRAVDNYLAEADAARRAEAEILAMHVWTAVHGQLVLWRTLPSPAAGSEAVLVELEQSLLNRLLPVVGRLEP